MDKIEFEIAKKVKEHGGSTYYVGGFVRDKLLGVQSKDVDIEVHNIKPNVLYDILKEFGEPLSYGKNFGIYSLKNQNIDISLPRLEKNTGRGHRDFEIYVDPDLGLKKATKRRDFTINAMMIDVLSNKLIDFYNGRDDLNKRIIRHIDDNSFVEDPLRVFRAAQFAARFNFKICEDTIELCKKIDTRYLSSERIFDELKKALIKSKSPSIFFKELNRMNQLDFWFKEIKELINIEQNPIYHPEGNVFNHTMQVIDEAIKYENEVIDPFNFIMFCLVHDIGKIDTTFIKDGIIHSYNHEEKLDNTLELLKRLKVSNDTISYIKNMVPLHMKLNVAYRNKDDEYITNSIFDKAFAKEDLIYFSLSEHCLDETTNIEKKEFFFDRLKKYDELISKEWFSGDELIKEGFKSSPFLKDALLFANRLRLKGIDKDSAFKETIHYLKSVSNNFTKK